MADSLPPLLPQFSGAPRPDLSSITYDDYSGDPYDQFFRDWYGN